MADTLTAWLERYNHDFGTRITKADLHGKKIYDLVGPSQAATARAYLDHPEFFLNLPLMEGSQMESNALPKSTKSLSRRRPWTIRTLSRQSTSGSKNIPLSYRTKTLCFAGTKASSAQTS